MTHDVKLTNNSDRTLSLNLNNFFTLVSGPQVVILDPTAVHECQADCNDADTHQKFFLYCLSEGIVFGREGLRVELSLIPTVIEE